MKTSDRKPGNPRYQLIESNPEPEGGTFAADVADGLATRPRSLPCRYIYDEVGSKLFEEICTLPEYYLTRAERSILTKYASRFPALFAGDIELIELGSGNADKTRIVIEALLERQRTLRYVPIDIARDALDASAAALLVEYPLIEVHAIAGEYEGALATLKNNQTMPRLIMWLGSSVGNLHKPDAARFLGRLRNEMTNDDRLLIGIDLRKDRDRLERAYNDSQGVTARFSLNLLARINRELGGNFALDQFGFQVHYDEVSGSVESHLKSLCNQQVSIEALGAEYSFAADELVHTEDSYKYSLDEIEVLARDSGMTCEERWLDHEGLFSLNLFGPLPE